MESDTPSPQGRLGVVRLRVLDANPDSRPEGLDQLPGRTNYLIGNDLKNWTTDVPTYARVRYPQIYQGIDLIYYSERSLLEYDFVVGPGIDPSVIALDFEGIERTELDAQGDLRLHQGEQHVLLRKPFIYQEVDGSRSQIAGGYIVQEKHRIGFDIGAYDADQPLIIDPVLTYSSYFGGGSSDIGRSIALDAAGNVYVVGHTISADFPTADPFQAMGRSCFRTAL